jgi:hypothetical protein
MGSQAERYKSGVMPYAQMTSSSATQRFNDELDAELIGLKPVKSRIRDILYRPENERDYGQEAIEILLQVMENQRDDLVVILAGYADRMDTFFRSNPGLSSGIAHHLDFPDYATTELEEIAQRMLMTMQYRLSPSAVAALREYIPLRMEQPHFANARSIRNALDRARLRQANRLFAQKGRKLGRDDLMTIEGEDLRVSRVFE